MDQIRSPSCHFRKNSPSLLLSVHRPPSRAYLTSRPPGGTPPLVSGHIGHGEHSSTSIPLFHTTSGSSVFSLTLLSRTAFCMPRIIPFRKPCSTSATFASSIPPYLSARTASFVIVSRPFRLHIHPTYTACKTHSLSSATLYILFSCIVKPAFDLHTLPHPSYIHPSLFTTLTLLSMPSSPWRREASKRRRGKRRILRPAKPPSSKGGNAKSCREAGCPTSPFFVVEGSGGSRPTTLLKQTIGDGRPGLKGDVPPKGEDLRQVTARVRRDLIGIHPNPGPSERRHASVRNASVRNASVCGCVCVCDYMVWKDNVCGP